jgi:hypothetical protein
MLSRSSAARLRLLPIFLLLAPAASAAQEIPASPRWGDSRAQGLGREAMWPAPTSADWAQPCRIAWERSIEDALAVSRATRKPLLVCVNMDGEIASEHYAGVRWRDPEIAKLYEPYVCVVASVYRHTPRDYDEEGRRVECPRFGTVTCSEHIWIEPGLFERFFDGERVAPRHVMVELDQSETYDVYYAFDTASVFATLHAGIASRDVETLPLPDGDRPLAARVASPHAADRAAVEDAYAAGDREARLALLAAARATVEAGPAGPAGVEPPVDLLRQAVFGLDLELAAHARTTLARVSSPKAVDVVNEALRAALPAGEREALIAALERMGAGEGRDAERARTLAVVHRGLAARSDALDVAGWRRAVDAAGAGPARPEWSALAAQVEYRAQAAAADPEDAAAHLALAESYLALAVDPRTAVSLARDRFGSTLARLRFEDVRRAATRAVELGATGWRVDAALALAAYYLGDGERAYARAEAAALALPPGETGWSAMAVLGVFAQGRRDAIARAARAGEDWPTRWMTDVHAAYQVIAHHPLGSAEHVAAHVDFLRSFGAASEADRALADGLVRFPGSGALHDRFRAQVLADRGVDGLEPAYDELCARAGAAETLPWQAAYTALVAAEFQRRAREPEKARAAYDRGIEGFRAYGAAHPELTANAAHYVALALAGKARLALEAGDLDAALADALAAFDAHPQAAASLDGLGITPVATAQMLRARLAAADRAGAVQAIDAAFERLRAIDPALLELPAFERGGPRAGR